MADECTSSSRIDEDDDELPELEELLGGPYCIIGGHHLAYPEVVAAGPQAAVRMLKCSLYDAAETTLQQAFDDIAIRTAVTDYHPDAREGVTAFREKREARFS